MVITEIALLRCLPGVSFRDGELRSKLVHARKVMEEYTGRDFYFFQQVEDPAKMYIFGAWESLHQHMNEFIPSAQNQALLASLKEDLAVEWLQHIDAPQDELPLPKSNEERKEALDRRFVWHIIQFKIKPENKEDFAAIVDPTASKLQALTTKDMLGGWRIDKQDDLDEYVCIGSWESEEEKDAILGPESTEINERLGRFINSIEVSHMLLVDI